MAGIAPGTVLGGRFEIVGTLGQGGMATVYLARDRLRGDKVALKVIHPHIAEAPGVRERWVQEARAAGRVRHPAALVAHDVHLLDGHLALSMPYHPGSTLAEVVASDGPLPPDRLERLARRLAQALEAAHRAGVLHRDVSPRNILVDEAGEAVLTDFGLARLDGVTSRSTGRLPATVGYTAPEILEGHAADPRSDIYALGACLHLAATGRPPFGAGSPMAVLARQLEGEATPVRTLRSDLPPRLAEAIDAALARDPDARPQGARAFLRLLEAGPVREPSPGRAAERDAEARPPEPEEAPRRRGRRRRRDPDPAPGLADLPLRPSLPEGAWTVVVWERPEQMGRRRTLRQELGLEPATGTGWSSLARVFREAVRAMESLGAGNDPARREPEPWLAAQVALLASLPPDALEVPAELYEPRFRLVRATERSVARTLRDDARRAGFAARAVPAPEAEPPDLRWGGVGGSRILVALLLAGVFLAIGVPWFFIVGAVWLGVGNAEKRRYRGLDAETRGRLPLLPVAFENDLRPALRPDLRERLEAPRAAETDGRPAPPPTERPRPNRNAPTRDGTAAQGDDAPRSPLARTALQRIDDLLAALASQDTGLPDEALADLRSTAEALRAEALELAERMAALQAAIAGLDHDPGDREAIAQRVQRLEARVRAGEIAPDDPDLARSRSRLARLDKLAAARDEAERRLTALQAEMLAIGAEAASARLRLASPDTNQDAGELVERLGREVEAARRARRELT